ncbi:MAG: hypothetical protein RIK87_27240 [Fuerstiella sp.]
MPSARFALLLMIAWPACVRLCADEPAVRRVQAAWQSSPTSDSWVSLLSSETEKADDDLSAVPPLPKLNIEDQTDDTNPLLTVPSVANNPLESLSVPMPDRSVARELERRHRERDENYQKLMLQLRALLERSQQMRKPSSPPPTDTTDPAEAPEASESPEEPKSDAANPQTNAPETTKDDPDTAEQTAPPDDTASGDSPSPSTAGPPAATGPASSPDNATTTTTQTTTPSPTDRPTMPPALLPVPEEKPSSVFADSLSAQALVNEPVDRVGLADNLYALDELQIALEMYEQVDRKALPASEQYWVAYQTASCLRRLGRIPEAQERYRRLAGQTNAGWLARMSRWWLDQIDARVELETGIARQQKIVNALTEVLNASATE